MRSRHEGIQRRPAFTFDCGTASQSVDGHGQDARATTLFGRSRHSARSANDCSPRLDIPKRLAPCVAAAPHQFTAQAPSGAITCEPAEEKQDPAESCPLMPVCAPWVEAATRGNRNPTSWPRRLCRGRASRHLGGRCAARRRVWNAGSAPAMVNLSLTTDGLKLGDSLLGAVRCDMVGARPGG
jgi:hypothetical protein